MRRSIPLVFALLSCTPDPDPSDDGDSDTDSDLFGTFEGTSTRTRTVNGVESCTESHDLVGTPRDGECPDCLFAFDLQSTPGASTGDCPPDGRLTWAEDAGFQDIRLAFAEDYEARPPEGGAPFPVEDAVLWGSSSPSVTYYGGTAPPPDWELVGYAGAVDQGAVSWDGETLELDTELHLQEFESSPDLFRDCGPFGDEGISTFGPTDDHEGAVGCDLSTFDEWTFEATAASVVRVWVDNLPAPTPEEVLLPMVAVTDAETCMLAGGGPSFACANVPDGVGVPVGQPPLDCPGLEISIPTTGTYRVIVVGESRSCPNGSGGYVLRGNLDGAPLTFTPGLDDASTGTTLEIEERVRLVARVEP